MALLDLHDPVHAFLFYTQLVCREQVLTSVRWDTLQCLILFRNHYLLPSASICSLSFSKNLHAMSVKTLMEKMLNCLKSTANVVVGRTLLGAVVTSWVSHGIVLLFTQSFPTFFFPPPPAPRLKHLSLKAMTTSRYF